MHALFLNATLKKSPETSKEEHLTSDEQEWTHPTGDTMAHVLFHTATALAATPIPAA